MRLLIDTHAFLWFVAGDTALSAVAREHIENPESERYLSLASVWEIAIKHSLGRLTLALPLDELFERGTIENGIGLLGIERAHVLGVAELPFHHRDPFDRLLVAQAMREDLTIVGKDQAFDAYPVTRIW